MLESLRLILHPLDGELPANASRLGGVPHLPEGTAWPRVKDKPLAFIAQLNLAEVAALDLREFLPNRGMLYFFFDAVTQPWKGRPEDGLWKVLYVPSSDNTRLIRVSWPEPLPGRARFHECAVRFEQETTLPPLRSLSTARLDLSEKEVSVYLATLESIWPSNTEPIHRVFGHPDPIQADMRLDLQFAWHGVNPYSLPGQYQALDALADAGVRTLIAGASEWLLLLQVDSDHHRSGMESCRLGTMWSDAGRIYFFIRREDLARLNFDSVWLVLQSH